MWAAHHDSIRPGDCDKGVPLLFGNLPHPRHRGRVPKANAQVLVHFYRTMNPVHAANDVGPPIAQGHEFGDFHFAGWRYPVRYESEGVAVVASCARGSIIRGGKEPPAMILCAE